MIQKGEKPKLSIDLQVEFTPVDSGYNIIAEIPGTDLKDEVVMIGAHFDSWHGGTGATDNGTGSAVCMEAMRILRTLHIQPRRTIRIGLWGGEEEGLLGSAAYVKKYLGEREGTFMDAGTNVKQKPAADKFDVYFNNDNGSGKVRGVYMQGNDAVRPIFRKWLAPFDSYGAATLSLQNTGGTDHLSFDAVGLPGFQFIQDEIEYSTRTHHATMDVYDRAQPDDLKQAATIMAAFAYNAAMRAEKFPRKPLPVPTPAVPGSN
jgi:Zn-dependent M28 family amino/carboxypeptidase